MIKKSLDIVIVNWNSKNHLRKCIKSILKYPSESLDKIIIVDNNSNDDSLNFLEFIDDKRINLIKNKKNHGFAKACNQGAKLSDSKNKYILFLNPDIIINKKVLDKSVYFMERKSSKSIGIFGIALTKGKKITNTCRRFPSLLTLFADTTGLSLFIKNIGWKMLEWDHKSSKKVDQLIGAYFLIRRDLFQNLNGFDERFFVYSEEVDLSYRAMLKGYSSYYYHRLKCFHYGGGCTENILVKRLYLSNYGRLLYFKKHLKTSKFLISLFLILIIEPFSRLFLYLIQLNFNKIICLVKAYLLLFDSVKKNKDFLKFIKIK